MTKNLKDRLNFFFLKKEINKVNKIFDKKKKNIIFQVSTLYHFEIIKDLFISLKKEKKLNLVIAIDHLDFKIKKYLKKFCRFIINTKYIKYLDECDILIKTSYEILGHEKTKKILIFHGFPVKNTNIKKEYLKNIDLYFLQSNLEKKVLKFNTKSFSSKISLKEVGYTKLDKLFKIKKPKRKRKKSNIIYAPSWDEGTSLRVYGKELILNISNAFPNDKIYVKPHPALLEPKTSSNFEFYTGGVEWEKEINKIKKKSSNVYLVKDNLTDLISICDVLVTDISGAALEFIYFQKKVIFIDSPIFYEKVQRDRKFDVNLSKNNLMFNSGRKFGFVVKNLDHLIKEIKNNRIKKNIKQFRKKYPYFNEGNSINVAKKIILEI